MSQPQFDVIIYGASGFTGRLVAEYLADRIYAGQWRDDRLKSWRWFAATWELRAIFR